MYNAVNTPSHPLGRKQAPCLESVLERMNQQVKEELANDGNIIRKGISAPIHIPDADDEKQTIRLADLKSFHKMKEKVENRGAEDIPSTDRTMENFKIPQTKIGLRMEGLQKVNTESIKDYTINVFDKPDTINVFDYKPDTINVFDKPDGNGNATQIDGINCNSKFEYIYGNDDGHSPYGHDDGYSPYGYDDGHPPYPHQYLHPTLSTNMQDYYCNNSFPSAFDFDFTSQRRFNTCVTKLDKFLYQKTNNKFEFFTAYAGPMNDNSKLQIPSVDDMQEIKSKGDEYFFETYIAQNITELPLCGHSYYEEKENYFYQQRIAEMLPKLCDTPEQTQNILAYGQQMKDAKTGGEQEKQLEMYQPPENYSAGYYVVLFPSPLFQSPNIQKPLKHEYEAVDDYKKRNSGRKNKKKSQKSVKNTLFSAVKEPPTYWLNHLEEVLSDGVVENGFLLIRSNLLGSNEVREGWVPTEHIAFRYGMKKRPPPGDKRFFIKRHQYTGEWNTGGFGYSWNNTFYPLPPCGHKFLRPFINQDTVQYVEIVQKEESNRKAKKENWEGKKKGNNKNKKRNRRKRKKGKKAAKKSQ